MACCNVLSTMILIPYLITIGEAQEQPKIFSILDQTEDYQQRFVRDFLKDRTPSDTVPGYPQTSNHHADFALLMKHKKWALPMAEERIMEWRKAPEFHKEMIEKIVGSIAYTGTVQALDFTARVLKDWPNARRWISMAIYSQFGSVDPNFIATWYYALDSKDPLIKEIARETIPKMIDLPEGMYGIWGEAIIDRYRHEPTTMEILNDPLIELAQIHGHLNHEVLRQRLASVARESYARQQTGSKKAR